MEPIERSAAELSAAVHAGQLSCREVMAAHLDRIEQRNPALNAIITLRDRDELMAEAATCDDELAGGFSRGWLHGLPVAVKDLAETKGLRTTSGSRLLAHHVPAHDCLMVRRMRADGCIVIGKTNVPEFGLGSHTFNEVAGVTRNPYNTERSAGGSSGGAAVALATRMVPVADGSDYMGSLRNPAAWNNVFGFRPSQGRVPAWPVPDAYLAQMSTEGPMARTVLDMALLLGTQSGPHMLTPLALDSRLDDLRSVESATAVLDAASDLTGLRIGWLGNLGGHLAVEDGILDVCRQGLNRFLALGAVVDHATLPVDLDAVWSMWLTWRHQAIAGSLGSTAAIPANAELMKPELLWEIEQGQRLTGGDLALAARARTDFHSTMVDMFRQYDLLVLPAAQVWPFPVEWRWPTTIADRTMDTYHRWMETTIYATLAGLPAASVPVGFSTDRIDGVPPGLPMGMQIIGPPRADLDVLAAAHAYESTLGDLAIGSA